MGVQENAGEPQRPAWKRSLQRRLLAWFDRNARDLPWRRTDDLYRVWVSEIMLQQTQVATVIPYYERFLTTFPTIEALAAADVHEVLRQWEGLGYYRRARQLHAAAQQIVNDHGGRFPEIFDAVLRLPGIGRYTAGAILSIARGQRLPILEANTIRLYSRLMLLEEDPTRGDSQRQLWAFAESILPRTNVGTFNQALMELGSSICTVRQPHCGECPLVQLCPTAERGWQERIPAPKRKTNYEEVREAAVVVSRKGRVLLRQCAADERWAGLWDFPRFRVHGESDLVGQLAASTLQLTGARIGPPRHLTTMRHGVTRFRITLECYMADCAEWHDTNCGTLRWLAHHELERYPLSVTGRKISQLLAQSPASA